MSDLQDSTIQLREARDRITDAARPDIVSRITDSGKMTARQRINALLDPGSEVEFGTIAAATAEGAWVPEPGGVDFVGTVNGQAVIASSTDYTDHGGGYGAGRLGRLFATAYERRWPVILFVDGGGSRARHPRAGMGHIETSGPIGRFSFLDGLPELNGWVPTIAIVSGPAFAGHASLAGMSDLLISTPGSSIGMGGPPMVEAALGHRLTPNELAGAEMHELGGGIDLLVASESEAIDTAKQYLHFYNEPSVTGLDPARTDLSSASQSTEIIASLVDKGSQLELRPNFAPSLITLLARINGHTIGILANNRAVEDGAITQHAATKISRFVELCNAYDYPILSLIDTPGCTIQPRRKKQQDPEPDSAPGLNRWHTRALLAHQQRTVPLIAIQTGSSGGVAGKLMTGASTSQGVPLMKLGWPNVQMGRRDGFSVIVDHNAFDDIIAPEESRERVVRLLNLVGPPSRQRDQKKHWIDLW